MSHGDHEDHQQDARNVSTSRGRPGDKQIQASDRFPLGGLADGEEGLRQAELGAPARGTGVLLFDEGGVLGRTILFVHTAAGQPGRGWVNSWMPFEQVPDPNMPYQDYNGFMVSTKVPCIRWWAFPWKEPGKRGCELGLLHELGHEVQWLIMGKEMREWKIWQPHQSHGIGTRWKKKGHADKRRYAGFRAESDQFFSKVENWVVRNVETPAANEINAYHRAGRHKPNDRRQDDEVYVQHLEPTRPQYLSLFYLDPRWTDNVQDPALKKVFGWQYR